MRTGEYLERCSKRGKIQRKFVQLSNSKDFLKVGKKTVVLLFVTEIVLGAKTSVFRNAKFSSETAFSLVLSSGKVEQILLNLFYFILKSFSFLKILEREFSLSFCRKFWGMGKWIDLFN